MSYNVLMKIVADANIFLAVLLEEPEKKGIIKLTGEADLLSPEILPYEIGNAFSAMFKRNRIDAERIQNYFDIFKSIPVRHVAVDIPKSLAIATMNRIYAYDAYYLELAQRLNLPIMTLDLKMIEVATKMNIQVMEVS